MVAEGWDGDCSCWPPVGLRYNEEGLMTVLCGSLLCGTLCCEPPTHIVLALGSSGHRFAIRTIVQMRKTRIRGFPLGSGFTVPRNYSVKSSEEGW